MASMACRVSLLSILSLLGSATAAMDRTLRNSCQSPSLPAGAFHVVLAGYEEKNCFTNYLWNMGLTNAHVFVYRRVSPDTPVRRWQGPCGMVVKERLMLPNYGKELSVFHSYVLEHYDSPPWSVLFLHGHGPHAHHTDCSTIVGRGRLFYTGLAAPLSHPGAAEFAQHMITLTRFTKPGDTPSMLGFPEDNMSPHGNERYITPHLEEQWKPTLATCMPIYLKWSVNLTSAGYYTCCATFILPWDRILRYPKGFYKDALAHALDESIDDYKTSRACWEHVVWAWYQEPALSPNMIAQYRYASELAQKYDLSTCSRSTPVVDC